MDRTNENVKTETTEIHDALCQGLGCSAIGTQNVLMPIGNTKVISLLACEKCAKKLRC